jgi:hypothetical protein
MKTENKPRYKSIAERLGAEGHSYWRERKQGPHDIRKIKKETRFNRRNPKEVE